MKKYIKQAFSVKLPKVFLIIMIISFLSSAFYPTDKSFYLKERKPNSPKIARITEDYIRFINNGLQVLLPIIQKDPVGIIQMVNVSILTTAATQGLKEILNDVTVFSVRLGERPSGKSRNMPSGHSSMASCGLYFVARRYGYKWLFVLIPVLLLTMYTRFVFDAHTISATIAGASLGMLCAALCTSKFTKKEKPPQEQKDETANS